MNTALELLDCIHTHLLAFELPELWSVNISASSVGPRVSVQLAEHQPPELARGLLIWADTLTGVTVEAWRVPCGDCVHLSVTGELSGGTAVCVFGGVPFTGRGLGAELEPDSGTVVSLATLRGLATVGEVAA